MVAQLFIRKILIVSAIALSVMLFVSACTSTKASDQTAEKKKLAQLRSTNKYKEKKIEVGDNFFSAKEVTIEPGTIVIWTNKGNILHDVSYDDALEVKSADDFSSETLRSGDIHVWLFDQPGTYNYHCHFHGGPKRGQWGSITVSSTGHNP